MKKLLFFLFIQFFGFFFAQSMADLQGKWTGILEANKKGSFTFFPDGYVNVEMGGMVIHGRNFIIPNGPNKGKTGHVKYTVDFSKKPSEFSLTASSNGHHNKPEESNFLHGLIEFTKEDEILLFIDFDNENPKSIDPSSVNTILMRKDLN